MSSPTEALISMLLPSGDASYRDDVFHDILDNSGGWLDIPINDKFKFTASLWGTHRLEPYNSAFDFYTSFDYDGVAYMQGRQVRYNVHPVITLWENNVPLYSMLGDPYDDYPSHAGDIGITYATCSINPYDPSTSSSREYFYHSKLAEADNSSWEFIITDESQRPTIESILPFGGYSTGSSDRFTLPKAQCNTRIRTYLPYVNGEVLDTTYFGPAEDVEIRLVSNTQGTYTSGAWTAYPNPFYAGTFSDLTEKQLFNKWREVGIAIADAKQMTYRESWLDNRFFVDSV